MDVLPCDLAELGLTLFEQASDALFLLADGSAEIAHANAAAEAMTGRSCAELRGRPLDEMLRAEGAGTNGLFHHGTPMPARSGFLLRGPTEDVWVPVQVTLLTLAGGEKPLRVLSARDVRGQRSVEDQLRAKEAELRRVLASVSDCVWSAEADADGEWTIRYCSPVIEQITGLAPEAFAGGWRTVASVIHPEDLPHVANQASTILQRLEPGVIEHRVLRPDGAIRWVRQSMQPGRAARGGARVDAVVSDITDRKRAEEARLAGQQLIEGKWQELHNLFKSTSVGLALYDTQCRYVLVNQYLAELNGRTADEHVGQTPLDILPGDLAAVILQRLHAVMATGKPIHEREIRATVPGRPLEVRFWDVSYFPNLLPDHAVQGVFVTIIDITHHKRIEERLSESERRYRDLVETSNDLIWSLDARGHWTYVNGKAARMIYGHDPDEMIGRPFLDFLAPEFVERELRTGQPIRKGQSVERYETVQVRKDGRRVHLSFNAIALRDQRGNLLGSTGTATDITQWKEAEAALLESRERFEKFMNRIPMVGFIKDAAGRMLYVNQGFVEKFERPAAHFLGKTDHELWPAEVAARLREADLQVMAGTQPVELREFVPTADGQMREWWAAKFPFRDQAGNVFVGGIALDLSERQQLEQALLRSEERYRQLWQRNLAGGFRAALDGRILDCNDSFARLFGFTSRAEMLNRSTTELYFDLGVRAEFLQRLRELQTLSNYEMRMRRADGASVWVLENVSLLVEDGAEVLEGTIIDISERKRTEEALRASEANYRTLIGNLDQGIFLKDGELRYRTVNAIFCNAVRRTEQQLVGKTIQEVFPKTAISERSAALELRVLREGRSIETEEELKLAGKRRIVRISRTPVRNDQGAIVGVLGIGWDVTEHRALESQLRHVQKMDAIGQLAGGVAHDFNNLLTIMLGNLSYIRTGNTDLPTTLELVKNAETAGLRAAELTQTLLGFSRRAALATIPFNINLAIDEVVRLTRSTLPTEIELKIEPLAALWPVQADPSHMNQILTNLTLNARDAMPRGGKITYRTSHFVPDAAYLATHVEARPGEYVRLQVNDTGHGVSAELRQRIFEPFFTTKEKDKGTGLGLAIVFSIVKQHHGWIVCESGPAHGTTFDIFLPRCEVAAHTSLPGVGAKPADARQATILLVDDEAMIRQLVSTILTKAGYAVLQAENGVKAIDLFRDHQDKIALVILDAVMPRLSGRETLRELVKIAPGVVVLFSSGFSTEQFSLDEFPQVRGFLSKPYRAEQLIQKVAELLDASRDAAAAL